MEPDFKETALNILTKAENILVIVADKLGFDATAAGLAAYLSLLKLGKNASIIAQEPSVDYAQRIYGVNHINKIQNKKTPVVVIENAIDTVDKVTYSLQEDKLKVVIHPLAGSSGISRDQISFEYSSAPADLIFAIGFDNIESLQNRLSFPLDKQSFSMDKIT